MLDRLGLHHLRALDAIVATGSVTRASEQLGLSQSALSHQLATLRDVMGDPLVVRGKGGLVTTPRAQALAEPLRRALADLAGAINPSPPWDPASAQRRFVAAIPDHYVTVILANLLPRLQRDAPGIDIDVRSVGRSEMEIVLEEGRIDVAAGAIEVAPETLRSRRLRTEDFACVVRRDHPGVGETLDLDTFCALSHVLITPGGDVKGLVDSRLEALGRRRRIQVTTTHFLAAPLIVASSDLLLTGPRRLLQFMAERSELRLLEPPEVLMLPTFTMGLLWHERMHADEGHRWFREQLASSV